MEIIPKNDSLFFLSVPDEDWNENLQDLNFKDKKNKTYRLDLTSARLERKMKQNHIKKNKKKQYSPRFYHGTEAFCQTSIFVYVFFVSSLLWELPDKGILENLQFSTESLWVTLEFWYVEHGQ